MLADLLLVQVEIAPLVEVSLGEIAQYFVLSPGNELLDRIRQGADSFQGRVGFLRADFQMVSGPPEPRDLEQRPGVVGRADQFVEAQADVRPLVRRLLGRTFFVRTLDDAMALGDLARQHGLTLVTLAGERLAPDGTLVVGPCQASTGLISRRSELRVLNAQMDQLRTQIAGHEATAAQLEAQVTSEHHEEKEHAEHQMHLASALAAQRLRTASQAERLEQLERQHATLESEARAAAAQGDAMANQLAVVTSRLAHVESELAAVEQHIERDTLQLDTLRREHARLQEQLSSRHVEWTKSEHRLESLRAQMAQCEQDQQERQRALAETRAQLDQLLTKAQLAQRSILDLETELAELHLRREKIGVQVEVHRLQRQMLVAQRTTLSAQAQDVQDLIRHAEKEMYQMELEAGQLEQQRIALTQRMREDYDIDLAGVGEQTSDEELRHREEVEQEIAELRQKINGMGSVNLEALDELQQLEARCVTLSSQHDDLDQAKASLEQIINRINEDSRRLFSETLDAVRGHFQSLFRRLFGGGHADIVLDEADGVDILESGLEIVARPPGKEPRSISLLSGGEKTLTCVALLLAIFRSRPSPFCVLDEVDAALDEANIERFIAVLTEFLSSTQFVVVTHSKKTMTAANTLYGVTMQESGVSKRVSVRFDDVSENGEIRESALQAAIDDLPAEDGSASEDDETQAA
jgi:chromosome segregation protein